MKKVATLILLLLSVIICKSQSVLDETLSWEQIQTIARSEVPGEGIEFEDSLSWEDIKAKAKAENKAIFIDFFTTWCGPCKFMDQNVYVHKEVGDYINKNFVSVRVQMDKTAKDNAYVRSWYETAKKLGETYAVSAYPTLLFLNNDGIPTYKLDQIYKPVNLIKAAKISLDPNNGFLSKIKSYQNGKADSTFILDLIMHAQELGLNDQANQIGRKYAASLKQNDLLAKTTLMILYKTITTSHDVGFEIFLSRPQQVEQIQPLLTLEHSNYLTSNIIRKEEIEPFLNAKKGNPDWIKIKAGLKKWGKTGDKLLLTEEYRIAGEAVQKRYMEIIKPLIDSNVSWNEVLNRIISLNAGKGAERLVNNSVLDYMNRTMKGTESAQEKFSVATKYYEQNFSPMLNPTVLNNWSWFSFLKINNIDQLERAIRWSQRCLKLAGSDLGYIDTYANLLHKVGRTTEAVRIEEKVLARDPENAEFKDTLEKMKKGEPTWNRSF